MREYKMNQMQMRYNLIMELQNLCALNKHSNEELDKIYKFIHSEDEYMLQLAYEMINIYKNDK